MLVAWSDPLQFGQLPNEGKIDIWLTVRKMHHIAKQNFNKRWTGKYNLVKDKSVSSNILCKTNSWDSYFW